MTHLTLLVPDAFAGRCIYANNFRNRMVHDAVQMADQAPKGSMWEWDFKGVAGIQQKGVTSSKVNASNNTEPTRRMEKTVTNAGC